MRASSSLASSHPALCGRVSTSSCCSLRRFRKVVTVDCWVVQLMAGYS